MPINVSPTKSCGSKALRRRRMIARQDHDERLLYHRLVFEIRLWFEAQNRDIELAALRTSASVMERPLETLISIFGNWSWRTLVAWAAN